ncbi:MAG: radical SAM/SPASM domain-containing protein [Thermodesulfobacteriota bacterium]|nr:radical SAM/SPASM domain-containing protein [Thermodesulfobacteriota bacterium]
MAARLGIGRGFRVIDLAITNECNLFCHHCSAEGLNDGEAAALSLADYKHIVRQGRLLDTLSWNITGGEPLLVDWIEDLIPILEPKRHYISIQTNCLLLSKEKARELARLGVNCITTSIDSADEYQHDTFRGCEGVFEKVFEGIKNAKASGMQVLVGATITHGYLYSSALIRLIRMVNRAGAMFLFNLAVPCGRWANRSDILITEQDRDYLCQLLDRYPMTSTDHEVGRNKIGCPAGMEKIYITRTGEVLPCPFIHVSFGNCMQTSLAGIVQRMQKVPAFRKYQKICIAAEDRRFHRDVFSKIYNGENMARPVSYLDIFPEYFTDPEGK